MTWVVVFDEAFDAEFRGMPRDAQTALAARAHLLEAIGPMLGRPRVDTLKNSKHSNMKELRFDAADGAWRAAFAFDTARQAIVLVAEASCGLWLSFPTVSLLQSPD
jgi:hypothetical protein